MDLSSDQEEFLPEISERIIYDSNSDSNQTFEEETAGFVSQPASSLNVIEATFVPQVMLENMGISEPECSCMSG